MDRVEDRRRLVHDVGHRHGNPLLSPSKNPQQELLLDAVELPLGPLAYGLALAEGSLEPGALLVPLDKEAWRNAHLDSSATD